MKCGRHRREGANSNEPKVRGKPPARWNPWHAVGTGRTAVAGERLRADRRTSLRSTRKPRTSLPSTRKPGDLRGFLRYRHGDSNDVRHPVAKPDLALGLGS